jgi:hypothetical protein
MQPEYHRMPRRRLTRSTTRLERAAIKLHRFLHANLGNTEDWPIKFTGTEEHTPELCRLVNELQHEMERRWTPAGTLQIHRRIQRAAINKR